MRTEPPRHDRARTGPRRLATCAAVVIGALVPGACHLVAPAGAPSRGAAAPEPAAPRTSWADRLLYTWENLGEVEPGLLYRSGAVTSGLLSYLDERCGVRSIVSLRREIDPLEREFVEAHGGRLVHLPMDPDVPPTPRQVLELIRVTLEARASGEALLLHCRAGADRSGAMVAIWRMLFQDVDDRRALLDETLLHYHLPPSHPAIHRTIETFRPELYRPFIAEPTLLDDEAAIRALEARHLGGWPLVSGDTEVVADGELRAGAAVVSLLDGWPRPIQMATYGPGPGVAVDVREPLEARALVLERGEKRIAIVSCDLLIADIAVREEALRRLAETGAEVDDLLLAATHTHTSVGAFVRRFGFELYMLGPYDPQAFERLVERVVTSVRSAVDELRAARVGAARVFVSGLNSNRRIGTTTDDEVGLVRVVDSDGAPIATIVQFAGHPILEPADLRLSSDYPGILARDLDRDGGVTLFLQGALGDLNAHPRGGEGTWVTAGAAGEVARELAAAIRPALAAIEPEADAPLASTTAWIDLPSTDISLLPDSLFVLEWPFVALAGWRTRYPLQAIRIGPVALVATASEVGCRLGLRVKRRSPAPFPLVVAHANDYAGYALTEIHHAKSKLDPSSFVALNGPFHGKVVVEAACDLLALHWGERLDPDGELLSPGARSLVASGAKSHAEALVAEEAATLVREDATAPQSRSFRSVFGDPGDEVLRATIDGALVEGARGGQGASGRTREVSARLRALLPLGVRVDAETGYRNGSWSLRGVASDTTDGLRDLGVAAERPFPIARWPESGNALRLLPRVGISAPLGDADDEAPYAFSPGAGVWRPSVGGALEWNWNAYRALRVEGLWTTAIDDDDGRRPGDQIDAALRYRERHGLATIGLDLSSRVSRTDRRAGGRRPVDRAEAGFTVGLEPFLSLRLLDALELRVGGILPLAHGGSSGAERGVTAGVLLALP